MLENKTSLINGGTGSFENMFVPMILKIVQLKDETYKFMNIVTV